MSISFWSVACKALAGVGMLGAVVVPPTIAVQQLREQPPSIEEVEQEEPSAPAPTPEPEEVTEVVQSPAEQMPAATPTNSDTEYLPPSTELNLPRDPNIEYAPYIPEAAPTVGEFAVKYAGKCPHDIPDWEGLKKDHGRAAALVLDTNFYTDPGLHTVENMWSQYRDGLLRPETWVGGVANGLVQDNVMNHDVAFYIEWPSLTVIWDNAWEANRPDFRKATGEYPAEWDTIATRLTNELRRIENGYNALCPND